MRAKKVIASDDKIKVPGYIVTYSDMVTLLLTFFVMLLSLSTTQDPELFNSGRDSFVRSIRGMGLGMLFGKNDSAEFDYPQSKSPVSNPEDTDATRNLDASAERTRRAFEALQQSMTTLPSKTAGAKYSFPTIRITFEAQSSKLNKQAMTKIDDLVQRLSNDEQFDSISIYVLGLAEDGITDKQLWVLSALRAKAVADYMSSAFSTDDKPSIYSCGAGPGKLWTGPNSPIPQGSQILIAVLRK